MFNWLSTNSFNLKTHFNVIKDFPRDKLTNSQVWFFIVKFISISIVLHHVSHWTSLLKDWHSSPSLTKVTKFESLIDGCFCLVECLSCGVDYYSPINSSCIIKGATSYSITCSWIGASMLGSVGSFYCSIKFSFALMKNHRHQLWMVKELCIIESLVLNLVTMMKLDSL